MLNVRLDEETEKELKKYSMDHDMSKTMVVKEALAMYFSKKELEENPYILGENLFGAASSNQGDLSTSYKSRLKKKLNEKHTH